MTSPMLFLFEGSVYLAQKAKWHKAVSMLREHAKGGRKCSGSPIFLKFRVAGSRGREEAALCSCTYRCVPVCSLALLTCLTSDLLARSVLVSSRVSLSNAFTHDVSCAGDPGFRIHSVRERLLRQTEHRAFAIVCDCACLCLPAGSPSCGVHAVRAVRREREFFPEWI